MRKMTCITCPNGCELEVDEVSLEVKGNKCPKGKAFAEAEIYKPVRTITTTVKTIFKDVPVLPVRVSKEIPKEMIFLCMREINKVVLDKRVNRGDVIIKNILNLGVDVIATSDKLIIKD